MNRYSYERETTELKTTVVDIGERAEVQIEAFLIYDARWGRAPGQEIAICRDREDAEAIVLALEQLHNRTELVRRVRRSA